MKTVFSSSDGWGCSMVEVAFTGLCNSQQGGRAKERRRMNATIKSR
jgi:hypothetical protein